MSLSTAIASQHTQNKQDFYKTIRQEFINGSAIDSSLFNCCIEIVDDTEVEPGGDVYYPIHEALNWRVTRFGYQARETLFAAILQNEDGTPWQLKLSKPRFNKEKCGFQKYETPKGNGSRAYLPSVPLSLRRKIAERYDVEVPLGDSFWGWLEHHPEIPIDIDEGGKKGLAELSLGRVAIALYGVNGGYRTKDALGNPIPPHLIPDIKRFAVPGREITLNFDQDAKPETRQRVNRAIARFGGLLEREGCIVKVSSWDGSKGKGVDDLIVNCGAQAFEDACSQALPLVEWRTWQRLKGRLTYKASVRLTTKDLSTLQIEELPQEGIVAIASAKATGKTNFIGNLIQGIESVGLLGHRICLIRNLCQRLGIDYRGDLDKVHGQYITGSSYTLRIGSCVDSLLALDPQKFAGCDLVLDEVCQVLRHLLTSSTCRKEGKLPALLARFRELVQVAKRVILADADLDNAALDYIRELRGDDSSVFLVRNDYQSEGYPVRYIEAPDASVVTALLLKAIASRKPSEVIFVATDSKAGSKALAKLAQQCEGLGAKVLLLNSETSGGEAERAFISNPDSVLARGEYDVIIASPSLATGVSIERQGIITHVFGVFYGASSTDADIAQSLIRVRENVPRTVWCAERGRNFCKVSQATNPIQIKGDLKFRTDATVRLLRSQLREDVTGELTSYDWESDPHINLYARISAEQNFSMHNLRVALLARLRFEGHQVTVINAESNEETKLLLRQAKAEIRQMEAAAIARARPLTSMEVSELESREAISPEDRLALTRHYLSDFYATDNITAELIEWDASGRRRSQILALEQQLHAGLASERDIHSIEKQAAWDKGVVAWDIGIAELKRQARERLGLEEFINPDREWTAADLEPVAAKAREQSLCIKKVLNFGAHDGVSDTQIVHQLLEQMGLKVTFRWQRIEGKKKRVYRLDTEHWQKLKAILAQRACKRDRLKQSESEHGSPPSVYDYSIGGDPYNGTPQTQIEQERTSPKPKLIQVVGAVVTRAGSLGRWVVEAIAGQTAKVKQLNGWGFGEFPLDELTFVQEAIV
ncbi:MULTISPECIES: plasmid replication protein, CyRepA1 family [Trichocoleus]|uniref:DUF3854 domain-containing protein n=1 Tax=Trichocoleus desertorum GB2-A4 TaxID=2933944 RepID=A0ABV0JHK4_9CYAN|nr:plasmid replication protein, CyRepA1 family [Trichocoleus sp. FACHB-46]MBD1864547.1 DUF3854 domain-containing protein [Trichocoleus sp. FACHB-46]